MHDLDFIPTEFHRSAMQRKNRRAHLGWFVLLLAMMAGWIWSHELRVARAGGELNRLRNEWTSATDRCRLQDELISEANMLKARESALVALNDAASLSVIVAELGLLLPEGAVLTELTYKSGQEVASAAPHLYGSGTLADNNVASAHWPLPALSLTGAARSNSFVSAFTAKLGGSDLFADVQSGEVSDAEWAGRKVRKYTVDCTVRRQSGGEK